jgi:hypothetical protein
MIRRLNRKDKNNVFCFLSEVNDTFEDIYITEDKERKFLKRNWSLIEKVLKYQEVYGLFDSTLKGLLIILRGKGFRPYIKILTANTKYLIDLLMFLKWNYSEIDLYFKLKKENPLIKNILKTGFVMVGDRGKENLYFKKGIKILYKITPKDTYLVNEEKRLY